LTEAHACNLILEGNSAKGIKFIHGGQTYEVYVRHEVIISCGTYNSPQLLELSGIGDSEILKAAGVECKVDLHAVGENFQDHILCFLGYELAPGNPTLDALHDPKVLGEHQKIYAEQKTGALAAVSACMGFLPYCSLVSEAELDKTIKSIKDTPNQTPFQEKQYEQIIAHLRSPKSANVHIVMVPATGDIDHGIEDQTKLFPVPKPGQPHGIIVSTCVEYPASRGSVHITSSDPFAKPRIDPGYASHPADAAVAAAGMAFAERVANNRHCKDHISRRYEPNDMDFDLQNLENGAKQFQKNCMGEYHPIGTCSMSQVVDERLRVKGVNGLRVVDASIMPNHVSGNILSSVYVIGEKGADLIKEDSPLFA